MSPMALGQPPHLSEPPPLTLCPSGVGRPAGERAFDGLRERGRSVRRRAQEKWLRGGLESCSMELGLNPVKVRLVFPERSLHCRVESRQEEGRWKRLPR